MKWLAVILCFCVFVLSSSILNAQEANCVFKLKGKVLDSNTKKPLDFATLQLQEINRTQLADENGSFVFDKLCKGNYTLACTHIGCATEYFSISITTDTVIKIKLDHKDFDLTEVTVARHKKESAATQHVEQLEGKKLDELRGLSLGEALKTMSGVSTLKTGSTISKPIVHGLHSNRVLILNNGIRQEGQQWGTEHAPEIDAFLAKKITLIKGASSLRYGSDAIGGVILVEPNPLPTNGKVGGEVNYVVFSNNWEHNISAILEGNHARVAPLSWRVQGTFKRAGNAQTPDYYLKNTGLYEGNFSADLGWKKSNYGIELYYSRFQTKIGIFSAAHLGSLSDLYRAIQSKTPLEQSSFTYQIGRPYQFITHDLLKAKAYVKTGSLGDLTITFARQSNRRDEYDKTPPRNDSLAGLNHPAFRFKIQTFTLDAVWEHKSVKGFSGTVGADFMTQTNNSEFGYLIPNYWNFSGGVFVIERYTYKKLEIEAGLRFDYKWLQSYVKQRGVTDVVTLNFAVPSASIGFDYHILSQLKWNFNFGTAWRAPAPNELYSYGLHHGAAAMEIGDRNFKKETSYQLNTSLEWQSKYIRVDIGAYQNFMNGFIYLVPDTPPTLTIRGFFPVFKYKQTNASLSGLDANIVIEPVKGLELTSKTSLLWAYNTSKKQWLEQMPANRFENSVRYTHEKNGRQVFFGINTQYVMQQKNVPSSNVDYLPAPAAYFLLGFESGADLFIAKQKFTLGFSIYNMLNTRYRDYLDRFRYYADETGINCAFRLKVPF